MNKLLMAAFLWVGLAQAGWALTVEERLLAGLQDQGYTIIEKGYTFLGRLRIVAESDVVHREIVVNPGTGEILRDYAIYISDMPLNRPSLTENADNSDRSTGTASRSTGKKGRVASVGTAGVAVSTLTPGSSTLGSGSLQVETGQIDDSPLLDTTILPMTSGTP